MLYSLAWIAFHLQNKKYPPIDILISDITKHICEVEGYTTLQIDTENLFFAEVVSYDEDFVIAQIPELNKVVQLPHRGSVQEKKRYLVYKKNDSFEWSTTEHLGGNSTATLPALTLSRSELLQNQWRSSLKQTNYIIEVDNKSIGNRPDLWCHRGMAREIALLYDNNLINLSSLCSSLESLEVSKYRIVKAQHNLVPYMGIVDIPHIHTTDTPFHIAQFLCQVNTVPKNGIVDITNYVMLDIGHPMHAFDGKKVGNLIRAHKAEHVQSVTLLDSSNIEIHEKDIILSSENKDFLSLGGLIGGESSCISSKTSSLVLEAGLFDNNSVRNTSQRLNITTEASKRFEKGISAQGARNALERAVFLLSKYKIIDSTARLTYQTDGKIDSNHTIKLPHEYIEKFVGIKISPDIVTSILTKLEFKIHTLDTNEGLVHIVQAPYFRTHHDISIKEDIIEEIIRHVGLSSITPQAPEKEIKGHSLHSVFTKRNIQNSSKNILKAHEVINYGILDSSWGEYINYETKSLVKIKKSDGSSQKKQSHLIDSLAVHILKNISQCAPLHLQWKLFETAPVYKNNETSIHEHNNYIFAAVDPKNDSYDFFHYKTMVQEFFDANAIKNIRWKKSTSTHNLLDNNQSADIYLNDILYGYAGFIKPKIAYKVYSTRPIQIFICELNTELFKHTQENERSPQFSLDFSLIIPKSLSSDEVCQGIKRTYTQDNLIIKPIDWFIKDNWTKSYSLTIRIYFSKKQLSEGIKEHVNIYSEKHIIEVR